MIYGTMRVEDNFYPIVGLKLRPGGFDLTAQGVGPMSKAAGPVSIYDLDGEPVTHPVGAGKWLEIPWALEGDTVTVTYHLDTELRSDHV